jgi:hypothetical protein
MLRIRPEQLEILDDAARRETILRALPPLRALAPDLPDDALLQLVQRAVILAGRHEIRNEADLVAFFRLLLRIRRQLGHPAAEGAVANILDDPLLDGAGRVRALERLAMFWSAE